MWNNCTGESNAITSSKNQINCYLIKANKKTEVRSMVASLQMNKIGPFTVSNPAKTSWKTENCYAEDVLRTSWRHILKTSWRRLEDQQMFAGFLIVARDDYFKYWTSNFLACIFFDCNFFKKIFIWGCLQGKRTCNLESQKR